MYMSGEESYVLCEIFAGKDGQLKKKRLEAEHTSCILESKWDLLSHLPFF